MGTKNADIGLKRAAVPYFHGLNLDAAKILSFAARRIATCTRKAIYLCYLGTEFFSSEESNQTSNMKSIIKLFVGALIAMNAVVLALPTTEAAEGCDLGEHLSMN